jgi:hypothetical protein
MTNENLWKLTDTEDEKLIKMYRAALKIYGSESKWVESMEEDLSPSVVTAIKLNIL